MCPTRSKGENFFFFALRFKRNALKDISHYNRIDIYFGQIFYFGQIYLFLANISIFEA
jgi:hypothetical protein